MYCRLTAGDCAAMINQCTTLRHLKSIHAAMLRSHLHPTLPFLTTHLISQYSHLNSLHHAHTLFSTDAATTHSVASVWNSLIRGYTEHGPQQRAIELYRQMRATAGPFLGHHTYPVVIRACSQLRDLEEGKRIQREAEEDGFGRNVVVVNALIGLYGKCGCLETARKLFDEMRERTVVSWSAMIGAYGQNGRAEEAFSLFSQMLGEGIQPNRGALMNVLLCVVRSDDADLVYRMVVDGGFWSDVVVQNAVLGMYVRCGMIETARGLFDKMDERDFWAWNWMIKGYVRSDSPMEALRMFEEMKMQGIIPDNMTFFAIICACSSLASLKLAHSVHGIILKSLFEHDVGLENALIDMYVKCGSLGIGRRLFDHMLERDLVTWSTMISGYGMNSIGKDALDLFDQMKPSMKPDDGTMLSVLSACSHAGLVDEGWKFFNSMNEEFGVVPKSEHYACMIDLMGRGGQLKEAQEFIERMPIEPDSSIWRALLTACRVNSNVEVAESVVKSLLVLDPMSSRSYVVLSNIYKFLGKQEEADQIEVMMNERGVKKKSGHSFVEVKNNVNKFLVWDQSNPQTDEIYKELKSLMESARKEGYVPSTNLVLHDVDEETKEESLYAHSEKLAIAFGLLNSSPESEILAHKNLSVCVDCHTFAKFVSKVTDRVIVLRDSHRFHHFKGGICSCRDYW